MLDHKADDDVGEEGGQESGAFAEKHNLPPQAGTAFGNLGHLVAEDPGIAWANQKAHGSKTESMPNQSNLVCP